MTKITDRLKEQFFITAAQQNFRAFCMGVYGSEYKIPTHLRFLTKKLEEVEQGKLKKLMVFMPPRHGKSLTISKLFPAWYLGRNPDKHIIFTTYSQDFANDFGRVVRNYLADEKFKKIFPNCRLAPDSASVSKLATTLGGGYFAVGAGGPITGRGGSCVIIDDPLKNRQDANSPTIRKRIYDWYKSTLFTRLAPGASLIIVQTRWHEDDLSGSILNETKGKGWEVISMPALDDYSNPLWPEQWPKEKLAEIKASIGSYEWAALYQQSPSPEGGSIIKRQWLKTYRELPVVNKYSWSWDTAIKTGAENDYSVGLIWAECEGGYYLVDMWRDRVEYPELRQMVKALYEKYRSHEVLVEDKSSGQQLVQDFRRISNMPVIPVIPGKDMPSSKEERLRLVSPLFEAGKVFIPEDKPWLGDFIEELVKFPTGKHDDCVDATTQYLARRLDQISNKPRIRML